MKKVYIIIAAAALFAVGCHKEKAFNGMELVAEGFGGGTKAAVSGNASYWVAGETVNINGAAKTVQIEGNTAYVSDVDEAAQYRALYPASLNSSYDGTASSVTVTIPSSYTWQVDGGGRQVLDVPMAAYGTGSDRLVFKHLTAAITVEITNHYGFPVLVDNVTVSSSADGTQYQLCGSKDISLASSDISVEANASTSNNTVQVTFDGGTSLTVAQGATKRVQVPVLPVGSGNKFSISVTVHKEGDAAVTKTYTKTQTTGGAMGRAKMAYAGDTVGYVFTISSTEKVIIACGNLQKIGDIWRFAANQYDYYGTDQTEHQDMFSFDGFYHSYPWSGSSWHGVYTDRMRYLCNTRSVSNTLSTDARYTMAKIGTVNGVIIFPDEYVHPEGTGFTAGTYNGASNYTASVSVAGWAKMEAAGCVFLPAAGYNNGTWREVGSSVCWGSVETADCYMGSCSSYRYAYINASNVPNANSFPYFSRAYLTSVRLVMNAN